MANEVISYFEACRREGGSLQKGMNYRMGKTYSVILMSQRRDAPYRDKVEDDGSVLIYEGHDMPRTGGISDPKTVDQPEYTKSGSLTENGKFHQAAQNYKQGIRDVELIRVYEKIHAGIWSYNGLFKLVDSWQEYDGYRKVFKFKLIALEEDTTSSKLTLAVTLKSRRVIPTSVKLEVWKRDGGKCVICGAKSELHFDHVIPYSKGGTSITTENVQLLCARHNLEKRDRIE
ncbi:MAG: hypothetical protein ILNGONEN_02326 [Syntrophorhabdaceae bacterium]|nr:hypothetical protein [Syntrophorhabdaceae bacterium]